MKPIVLFSLMISLSILSSQTVMDDIKGTSGNINHSSSLMQKQTHSWLGVWIENIPMVLGSHLLPFLKKDQGVLVTQISSGSPAAKAGIQVYDVIAKFNDQALFSQQQFTQLIQSTAPETQVKLSLIRQGKLITQDVVLEARPINSPVLNGLKQHHPTPFSHPDFQRKFSHPFMNDPFFQPDFSRHFKNRFDNDMNQLREQMNQLQQQFNQRLTNQSNSLNHQPGHQKEQANSWFQFESIQIESAGNNKHRAEVKYSDSEGNKKEFIFEGKLEEIQTQIMAQENMDEKKKQQLLKALNIQ